MLRAEGHANADFVRALRDYIGHDAVKTDGGEQEREAAKEAGEDGHQMLLNHGVVGLLFQCAELQRSRFVDAGHGVAHGGNQRAGCHCRANLKRGVFPYAMNLGQRDVRC